MARFDRNRNRWLRMNETKTINLDSIKEELIKEMESNLENIESNKTQNLDSMESKNADFNKTDSKTTQNIESKNADSKTQNIESKTPQNTQSYRAKKLDSIESKNTDSKKIKNIESNKAKENHDALDIKSNKIQNLDSNKIDSKNLKNAQKGEFDMESKNTQKLDSIESSGEFDMESKNADSNKADSKTIKAETNDAFSIDSNKTDSKTPQNTESSDEIDSKLDVLKSHMLEYMRLNKQKERQMKQQKKQQLERITITKDKIANKLIESKIAFIPQNEHWQRHNQKVLSLTYINMLGLSHVREHNFEDIFAANFIKRFENIYSQESVIALNAFYNECKFESFVLKNFDMMRDVLHFSKEECYILHYFYLLRNECIIYPNEIELEMHAKIIARLHNLSIMAVTKILKNDRNKLITSGFIDNTYLFESRWDSAFERDKAVFFLNTMTQKRFFEKYGYKPKSSHLNISDFDYMGEKFKAILLAASKLKSGNILLYGSPGVGKNEIVNVIAKKLNREIICVEHKKYTNHHNEINNRILSFQALQSGANADKHIICFDECEDSLCYDSLHNKARINYILENAQTLNFFLSNSKSMDSAYLRRFDLVMHIKAPPKNKKIAMIKDILDSKIALDSKLLEQVALNENLSQGIILSAAKLASIFPKSKAQAIFVKYINENLRARDLPSITLLKKKQTTKQNALPYDISLIECSVNIVEFAKNIKDTLSPTLESKNSENDDFELDSDFDMLEKYHKNPNDFEGFGYEESLESFFRQDFDNLKDKIIKDDVIESSDVDSKINENVGIRILCYGISGSGKSEFAKEIARLTGRKILSYKASDILGKYVGQSEERLAGAFKNASVQNALLHIDEVDTFLYSRESAERSWEKSLVNEMLTQMEHFNGIFIATSNHLDMMDSAVLRRFDSKIEFRALSFTKLQKAFCLYGRFLGLLDSNALKSRDLRKISKKDSKISNSGVSANKLSASIKTRLKKLENICFGDFALIARESRLNPIKTLNELLERIENESKLKQSLNNSTQAKIGF